MRFISIGDYIDYIIEHPGCNARQLESGVLLSRRLQEDLLEVIKYMLCYYKPRPSFVPKPLRESREIILYKDIK